MEEERDLLPPVPARRYDPSMDGQPRRGVLAWLMLAGIGSAAILWTLVLMLALASVTHAPPWCPHTTTLLHAMMRGCT